MLSKLEDVVAMVVMLGNLLLRKKFLIVRDDAVEYVCNGLKRR